MKILMTAALAIPLALGPAMVMAGGSGKTPPGQREGGSLGTLTKAGIQEEGGRAQGEHASSFGTPRAGLANATGQRGNLSATLDFITSAGN